MIWLLLAAVGAASAGAVWGAATYGPWVAAGGVAAAWAVGRAASRLAGPRDVDPPAPSVDEISPVSAPGEEAELIRTIERQSQVAAEVELAAAVQQAFIPDGRPRGIGVLEVAGSYTPASRCGGDWWAAYELSDGAALVLVADVTGHGIGSARITAAARGAYDATVRLGGGQVDLPELLESLDAAVRRIGAGHYNMTCFAAVFDRGHRVKFAGAGHVPPYVVRSSEDRVSIDALVARGNPLGVATAPSIKVQEQALEAGDLLVFYSDGLIDCVSPAQERLGDRRMQRVLREIGASPDVQIGAVRDRIDDMVREFTGGQPQPDDITFVAVRLR